MFERVKQHIQRGRGHLQVDPEKCTYCGACRNRCPVKAITAYPTTKEWHVENDRCHRCGHCVRKCPKHALMIV